MRIFYSHDLLVYDNKCYLQLYLDYCPYKVVEKQTIDDNLFEADED